MMKWPKKKTHTWDDKYLTRLEQMAYSLMMEKMHSNLVTNL